MSKLPAIIFYPGDWLRDDVSGCSLAAQGLWLRMMIVMHSCEPYGYLAMNGVAIPPESVARRCACTPVEYTSLLAELDLAGVPSRNADGLIYSRRMVRDARTRVERAKAGRKGGKKSCLARSKIEANTQAKVKQKPEVETEVPDDLKCCSESIKTWLKYKAERGEKYKPTGLNALWARLRGIGVAAIPSAISSSMGSNYAGIYHDKTGAGGFGSKPNQSPARARGKDWSKLGGGQADPPSPASVEAPKRPDLDPDRDGGIGLVEVPF